MGSVYRPKLKNGKRQATYKICYSANGKKIIESTGVTSEAEAKRILKEREGRVATGQPILPRADKTLYREFRKDGQQPTGIRDDLRRYYATTGERGLAEVDKRLGHLDRFFNHYRAIDIDRAAILQYIEKRQAAGAANGTINREVTMLGTMLRHAVANNKLVRLPDLRKIKLNEATPRQGFFEPEQFAWVRKRLTEDLQVAVTIAYTFGWRMQSEVLALDLRHVDLRAGTLSLEPSMTKNGEGRVVYLTPELKMLLAAQIARVRALEKKLDRVIPYLFPHADGAAPQLLGTQRADFRKAWISACEAAGVPGKLRTTSVGPPRETSFAVVSPSAWR